MKVGEYVRTDDCIGKVYDICHKEEDYYKFIIEKHGTLKICDSDYIVKSSPNIIDLIEVGDYVNGCPVYCINYDLDKEEDIVESITISNHFQEIKDILYEEDIKSIVTKEKFSQMEYRIGE